MYVAARAQAMESLRELRKLVGRAQADVAAALSIKQPLVSKIEKQADMYLSTLRDYGRAVGGELELRVKLPGRRAMTLQQFGDAGGEAAGGAMPAERPLPARRACA
jgi:hypothetical protein